MFCIIENKGEKTLLGICYRTPDSTVDNDAGLFNLFEQACQDCNNCILMGDFNFRELKWDKPETLPDDHPLINCMHDNFLYQLVDKPTRKENFLDLVFSSDENIVENVVVREHFGNSDHNMVEFQLVIGKLRTDNSVNCFNYYRANYQDIIEAAICKHWDDIKRDNVNDMWVDLRSDILQIRDIFVPLTGKSKIKCKWANKIVKKRRRAKRRAWNKYIESDKDTTLLDKYKRKLYTSTKANDKAKNEFELRLANNVQNDSKSFYAYVRNKERNKVKVGPLRDNAGNIITEDKTTANIFNDYFASVFTVEDRDNIPLAEQIFTGLESEGLSEICISEDIVFKKLNELNVNKSPGSDDLHPKLFFELRHQLVRPLTKLFKLSLETGIVPQEWKDARVSPLFKKGQRYKPENYRPVSLTSIIGKVFESIIKDNLVEHLDRHRLIRNSQHGFTRGRSCLTNILSFMESVTLHADEGSPVDIVYLDFAKAFDKVPYERLFKKLEAHGVTGPVLNWIEAWLSSRRQKVCISQQDSYWRDVTSGVPQGSVLGPVLFLVYINDLDSRIISKLAKFADDTKLCKDVDNMEDVVALQKDLDCLNEWANDWQMSFNVDKCKVIHVGYNNKCNKYRLGNTELKSADNEKDLGVIIDNTLKFSKQCSTAVKSANRTLGLIKRTIKNRRKDIIVKLYKALVRPKLEYCVQAWRPFLRKDLDSMERVQRRATKMITECRGLSYENRLEVLGLISIEARQTRGDLIQVFKLIKGVDNVDYREFFQLAVNSRTRGHSFKICKVRSRLEIRKNFFSQRVVNEWNELPSYVVEAESVNAFKNRLDNHWKNT